MQALLLMGSVMACAALLAHDKYVWAGAALGVALVLIFSP